MTPQAFLNACMEAKANTSRKGIILACMDRQGFFSCPTCGKRYEFSHENFKDAVSVREFFISGMCQQCQDEIFTDI